MNRKIKNKTKRTSRPVPVYDNTEEKLIKSIENENNNTNLDNLLTDCDDTKADIEETQEQYETSEAFKSEVERFIEISKYFSSPLRKTASYVCENKLVSYPNPYRIEYRRGGVTTQHIRFCNQTLEPVYVKLYKCVPVMEQFKFINLSQSRCKRIPPGLTYSLGLIYDDLNEKPCCNGKLIFVASRKTTTPCYQICEIDLHINAQKVRLVTI
ncbi:unnamed protein product [Danaus chrysippus]|uniref:(African queen) hypothetical protein n=1 Tax=Danaus chrysippus TaxID=151541 RepID=A0A8J2W181_9NEOP|nr:unnamed protein product [Danaus chrysippus]